ncbi:MAG: NAD-dependent epimerase/dehydratase family protein [Pseudomonadota bacterium]
MSIVITGERGLLGRHMSFYLGSLPTYRDRIVALDRASFNDKEALISALATATAVIHCAGVNRGEDADVEQGNIALAEQLLDGLKVAEVNPHVVYMNSTHKVFDSPYARGKRAAHDLLDAWAAQDTQRKYTEMVLPHVFGEGGRPFYNSAFHTFCYQLAQDEQLSVNGRGQLELLHAQDIAQATVAAIERCTQGEVRLAGHKMSVASAAGKLTDFSDSYRGDVIPDLRNRLDLQMFNTMRSFLYPSFYPRRLKLNVDERGALFEAVKNRNGGQAFLSTTRPGITRGDHYHFNKVERFLVVKGEAIIKIRALGEEKVETFRVSGSEPAYVDMPTLHTHNITNVGDDELMTLFWSHEIFDPDNPDTFFERVESTEGQ